MIQKILPANDPILRKKSKPVAKVDKKILKLVKDLKETLVVQKDPEGIGLAAPQIGKNVRVFVIKPKDEVTAFINPKIIKITKEKKPSKGRSASGRKKRVMEGCLSIPNYYGPLRRAHKVKLSYVNTKGGKVIEEFEGIKAQIILHEIDHLNGVLFVDHLLEQKQKLYEYVGGEWEEVDLII